MKPDGYGTVAILVVSSLLSSCTTVSVAPQNPQEREILSQAVIVGTASGAVVGGVLGYTASKRPAYTAGGALLGGIIGNLTGRSIANYQIQNYRDIRLDNDELEALLNSARNYNAQVAAYNTALESEIAQLREKSKAQRAKIAKAKVNEAQQKRLGVEAQIAERSQLSETLTLSQKKQYQATLQELKEEDRKLDASIAKLRSIQEQARVG